MKKIVSFLFLFFVGFLNAQQLNCTVEVNSEKLASTNNQIFKTLQTAISEFVNKTDWTGEEYKQVEKINCSMVIILNSYAENQFTATFQVQSTRPVYNSTYDTPVFNYSDNDFSFTYFEFQNLIFNPSTYDNNLLSLLAFYSYMIIGLDAETYTPTGGAQWLEMAQEILIVAQQGGYKGWSQADGNFNRYFLINDLLSGTYDAYRQVMYSYHRDGLDNMNSDLLASKNTIINSISNLSSLYKIRPNAFLTRVFFDAKSDEIVSILSGGPNVSLTETIDILNRISPANASKWATITF
jgi:Domain of unknown function (DUF4835)